jgi:lipoprotein NlpD
MNRPARYRYRVWLAVLILLTACGGPSPVAPVSDKSAPLRQPESEYRTVARGDTLYSIAWESGRDYKELAAWNKIPPPYTIKIGQQIRLNPPSGTTSADKTPAKKTQPPAEPTPKPAATSKDPAIKPKPPATAKSESGTAPPANKPASQDFGPWAWPAKGKILNTFSETGANKGLDIGGVRNQAVTAAANGRVVYQGSGLRGYGQLIIIKHNEDFLSAYAHNDKMHVKEGDTIKRGQKIADMGSTGTDQVKLHFEIRRHGVPVDPLRYLPK